jgi:hypothetical protein
LALTLASDIGTGHWHWPVTFALALAQTPECQGLHKPLNICLLMSRFLHICVFINSLSHFIISGIKFLSSVLIAPVKNENGEVIMFILNFEDVTDAPSIKPGEIISNRLGVGDRNLKNSKYS